MKGKRGRPPKPVFHAEQKWIKYKDAKALLQCGKSKFFELLRHNQLRTIKTENQWFIEKASVDEFIATHNLKYNMKRRDYLCQKPKSKPLT